MNLDRNTVIAVISDLIYMYGITDAELREYKGFKMYEAMTEQDPAEKDWIAKNVKPRKRIEVKDGGS